MNLVSDMKILHAKKFKEGKIKQASFLKSFKQEIFELISLDYKPSEIKDYLEEKLNVAINMNSFYAWLNYAKHEQIKERKSTLENATMSIHKEELTSTSDTRKTVNTADILSSTDYD
jgi:IS30 family transposase